jgi:hypothetical protein
VSGGDDDDRDERPRRSWSEIDKLRDKPRARSDERRPRGAAAEARSRAATQHYLKKLDSHLFAKSPKRAASGGGHADAVRAALGTPELADACRAYLVELGPPTDPGLLSAFLDAPDRELQRVGLRVLAERRAAGELALTAGLRAQLRMLAEGLDDELAEAAEEALGPG